MYTLTIGIILWLLIGLFKSDNKLYPFDKDATLPIRGVLAVMIVLHHFSTLYGDRFSWLSDFGFVGVPICGMFLFLSGYGLQTSFIIKGKACLDGFIKKRLTKLLVPITLTVFIHIIAMSAIGKFNAVGILEGITRGVPILPHFWFVVVLITAYFVFYVFGRIYGDAKKVAWSMAITSMLYYFLMYRCSDWGSFWWNSIPGLILGFLFALYEDRITVFKNFMNVKCQKNVFVIFAAIISLYCIIGSKYNLPAWGRIFSILFPILIVGITKIQPIRNNTILTFLGGISYEIYLIHVTVMISADNIVKSTSIMFLTVCIATIIIAFGVNKVSKFKQFLRC